ncbi:TPA: hypothetical protein DIT23_04610 [candidate division WOR-3 bacterium]|nr:hypothetical protein [candidate division WOR-3 bacterium]
MKNKILFFIFIIISSILIFPQNEILKDETVFRVDSTIVSEFKIEDVSNDDGSRLEISCQKVLEGENYSFTLYRKEFDDTVFKTVKIFQSFPLKIVDEGLSYQKKYQYYLSVTDSSGNESEKCLIGEYSPKANLFKTDKVILFLMIIFYTMIIIYLVESVRKGKDLFVRKISGLDTLDEAVGRATEMGRPVLYVPGSSSMSDIATIASLNILGPVAKKIAEYETKLIVPNRDPIVMTVAKEVVKESYSEAGRPDVYNDNDIFFLTDSQFGYAAAISGIMTREKPATNLLLGMFWAESLIMAEAGNTTGAIQIAGTDAVTQLPFFITSCDYTIIGEELYAASAYLSREPLLLGTLKAQDYLKGFIIFVITLYFVILLISWITGGNLVFLSKILEILRFIFKS